MAFFKVRGQEVLDMPADQLRNRTVGSKMTESEYEQLVAVAERDGLTLAESQVGVGVDSGVFGAGQHGGNLRLPLRRSVDTLRTLLCDDLHPQRPPKPGEVLKDRQLLDGERRG